MQERRAQRPEVQQACDTVARLLQRRCRAYAAAARYRAAAVRASTLAWICLSNAIGGSTPAFTKLALEGVGPWTLVVVRQVLGTLLLLGLAVFRPGGLHAGKGLGLRLRAFSRHELGLVLLLSWVGFSLPQILNALGLTLSSATNGALLSPLEPIGILLGGALLLSERLTLPRVGAVGLGLAGATLIVLQGQAPGGVGDLRGDLLMALGHLAWAIYTLAAKPLLERHDPLHVAILAGLFSPLPLIPLALGEPFELAAATPALGWIAALAFLSTALGTLAWNRGLQHVSASTMAAFIFLQPLVGLLVGIFGLGEPVGWLALLGAGLIVSGVVVAAARGERSPAV
jgi:drug/metabolite transporter (DMT)-like permease